MVLTLIRRIEIFAMKTTETIISYLVPLDDRRKKIHNFFVKQKAFYFILFLSILARKLNQFTKADSLG